MAVLPVTFSSNRHVSENVEFYFSRTRSANEINRNCFIIEKNHLSVAKEQRQRERKEREEKEGER